MRRIIHTLLAAVLLTLAACAAAQHRTADSAPATYTVSDSYAATYRHGAVASDHPVASAAGAEMLALGGNAVDAAVATSFCLSVVRPYSCGIGGGGFMLIHHPGDGREPALTVALNYRETAPAAVDRDYYVNLEDAPNDASRFGVHAVAVPGTVRGLLYALEHHGTLDRATVLAPAIRAAVEGFPADANFCSAVDALETARREHPRIRDTTEYIWNTVCHGGALALGDRVTNPQQAEALRLIAEHGDAAFYSGPIAEAIASVMQQRSGPITARDLADYSMRIESPLRSTFLGRQIIAMPPPSSGGVAMQQILGLLDRRLDDIRGERSTLFTPTDADYIHVLTEAMKHAFADRAEHLADDDFVEVPVDRLTSAAYLGELASRIDLTTTLDRFAYGSVQPAPADSGTSHLCVIDADGMAVSCTETINTIFGSCVEAPGYGFALNNEMNDFTTIPGEPNVYGLMQSDRNLPEPGKRPLSSMSPTIVLNDGHVELIAGASGGPRIITGTLQCMLNSLLFEMPARAAVRRARIHHQWMPNVLQFEQDWPDETVVSAMQRRGHETGTRDEVGVVQMIRVTPVGIEAVSDPRKGGRPAGQ